MGIMPGINLQGRLKKKDIDVNKTLFYMYPPMACGLEVECGDGERILATRKCGSNIFGINSKDLSEEWEAYNIDLMCKQASPLDIPYRDESFNFVLTNEGLPANYSEEEIEKALKEIYRVSSNKYFLKLKLNSLDPDWYFKLLRKIGYVIEVWRVSYQGNLLVEARKY